MNIQEAVKKAKESGSGFTRQSYINITKRKSIKEPDNTLWFYPTNSSVGIIIFTTSNGKKSITPRWQPTMDDLLADDWQIYG